MIELTIAELEGLLKILEPSKNTNEYAILYNKLQKALIVAVEEEQIKRGFKKS